MLVSGQHLQHGARVGFIDGFAENFSVEHHGGIGAEDTERIFRHDRTAPGLGFAARQALDISRRGFLI
ncbi:hypothetical protein D3C76_1746040 [compost metagenome]